MNKFIIISTSTISKVKEYNMYMDEILPKIANELASVEVLSKYGYGIEVVRTHGRYSGFSIILVNQTVNDFALKGGGYVLTLEVSDEGKLQATQANIVDFTLDELFEIQNKAVEVLNNN